MSTMIDLKATIRTDRGKGFARRARQNGRVPAVIYGAKSKAESIYCEAKDVVKILRSSRGVNTLLNVQLDDGATRRALIRDYDIHPVRRTLLHCDLYDVTAAQDVVVRVPVRFEGRTAYEKAGGKRQIVFREVKLRCAPDAIPEAVVVPLDNVKALRIRLSELVVPEGAEILYRVDQPVILFKAVTEDEDEEEGEEGEEGAEETSEEASSES